MFRIFCGACRSTSKLSLFLCEALSPCSKANVVGDLMKHGGGASSNISSLLLNKQSYQRFQHYTSKANSIFTDRHNYCCLWPKHASCEANAKRHCLWVMQHVPQSQKKSFNLNFCLPPPSPKGEILKIIVYEGHKNFEAKTGNLEWRDSTRGYRAIPFEVVKVPLIRCQF